MPVFYVDTSALVKRYRLEQGTDVIDSLFNNPLPEDRFYTSFLSVLEVTSAVHRRLGLGQLDGALAHEILARLRRDLQDYFRLWPLNNDVVAAAVSVIEQYKLRSMDAIHLATALAIASLAPGLSIVMVSSDHEIIRAADAVGLGVLNPADSNALG